jgi:sulfate permease, SulP family
VLVPKLATTLRSYDRKQFAHDLLAGLIVGVVAIPLAIAFAIASGVTPDRGLWTSIIAGFLISALGGSKVQIGGPTGAFVVIVYGIVQKYGVDGLTVATFMAGGLLIVMGVAKLGNVIKFVPHPVIIGFTSAIAVTIAVTQLDAALGVRTGTMPAHPVEHIVALSKYLDTISPQALATCTLTIALLLLWPKLSTRVPAPFVALIATTLLVHLAGWPVATIGTKFGQITASVPRPVVPHVTLAMARDLFGPAITIATLGAIESLLSAIVADGMIGSRHRSNMELVAQGIANIASPMFGGIPATGAIARTATNVKSGGRTPVAGVTHALTVLLITVLLGRWAALIPLATLAGILLVVAYHMSEWRVFVAETKGPRSDAAVLLTTFFLTLFVDLTVAIGVGMVLASFLFMRRMAEVTGVRSLIDESADGDREMDDPDAILARTVPKGVEVYEVDGPFFFGAAETFKDTLAQVSKKPRVLILRMRHVPAIDSTGLHALRDLLKRAGRDGTKTLLCELQEQPLGALRRSGLLDEVGPDNVLGTIDLALAVAQQHMQARQKTPPAKTRGGE